MTDRNLLAPWVRRFLLEHLVAERNFARCTQTGCLSTSFRRLPYDDSWTMSNKRGIAVSPRAISGSAPSTPLRASSVPEHRNICLGVRKCALFPSRRLPRQ